MNAYAVEEGKIDLPESYKKAVETGNLSHGVEKDDYNAVRSIVLKDGARLGTVLMYLDTRVIAQAEDLENYDDIPVSMKKGIYGMMEDSVETMYKTQPTINVYAHLAEEWIPGYQNTSVYAAESGYGVLQETGIDQLWTVARNISYVFFIIIMIIVGFMIMFRTKLGGQTLVTLGNTLPNVILALIGVTFSFAIAGILIDIGGLIMSLLVNIFENIDGLDNMVTLESFPSLFGTLSPGKLVTTAIEDTIQSTDKTFFGLFAVPVGITAFLTLLAAPTAGVVGIGVLLLVVFIFIVATVGVFMVFMTLVKAYIGILINVITAPFQIAMSAIPGKGAVFINWVKNIFRNILIYPITFAILNLPNILYTLSDGKLNIPGPEKLTLGTAPDLFDGSYIGTITIFALQILVLFLASKADKYAEIIIPPTSSKEAQRAAQESQAAIGKIPLIGGLLVRK
jgi:hypothetical protein